jgi:predicted dehydrogenase
MGRHHLRVLRDRDDVEVVGLVDPMGDRLGIAGDLDVRPDLDLLLRAGIDLCVVATPTEDHAGVALQLADAGVPTFIEKPLALDASEADAVREAFETAGVIAAVGHVERFNPAIRALRQRLASGELGDVFQIATSRQGPFPNRIKDVGVVKDLASHDLDLTAWVAGVPYAGVAARTAHRAGRPHEDLVAVVGWLADGTVTNHLVNWLTPTKERRTVVTGERGCFVADTLTADLTFFANASVPQAWDVIAGFRGVSEGDMIRYAIEKPEPVVVQMEHFVRAVRGEPSEAMSLREGVATLRVADAALESARDGRLVRLDA